MRGTKPVALYEIVKAAPILFAMGRPTGMTRRRKGWARWREAAVRLARTNRLHPWLCHPWLCHPWLGIWLRTVGVRLWRWREAAVRLARTNRLHPRLCHPWLAIWLRTVGALWLVGTVGVVGAARVGWLGVPWHLLVGWVGLLRLVRWLHRLGVLWLWLVGLLRLAGVPRLVRARAALRRADTQLALSFALSAFVLCHGLWQADQSLAGRRRRRGRGRAGLSHRARPAHHVHRAWVVARGWAERISIPGDTRHGVGLGRRWEEPPRCTSIGATFAVTFVVW